MRTGSDAPGLRVIRSRKPPSQLGRCPADVPDGGGGGLPLCQDISTSKPPRAPTLLTKFLAAKVPGSAGDRFAGGVRGNKNVVPRSTPTSSHRRYRAPEVPGTAAGRHTLANSTFSDSPNRSRGSQQSWAPATPVASDGPLRPLTERRATSSYGCSKNRRIASTR